MFSHSFLLLLQIVDVREAVVASVKPLQLPNVVNMPLAQLRQRCVELDKSKPTANDLGIDSWPLDMTYGSGPGVQTEAVQNAGTRAFQICTSHTVNTGCNLVFPRLAHGRIDFRIQF